ncbi:MAG: HEPN domain-containing protein [Thermoleophilia bacterium]
MRIIEPCKVIDEEIAGHLRAAEQDRQSAEYMAGNDLDWAFNIAYNSILQAALAYMYWQGYQPRGEGKHYNTFEFLKAALPNEFQKDIARCQKLRKKRNRSVYGERGLITEDEAKSIVSFSKRFLDEILDLLPENIVKLGQES